MRKIETALAGGRTAHVVFTDRRDGDFHIDADARELERRRSRITTYPWTWLRQVHGRVVVPVDEPGGGAGAEADASVTSLPGAALAVQTADCAPVMLLGAHSIAAVHAGWSGAYAGVIEAAVGALRERDPGPLRAIVGPCIQPANYRFGIADLDRVAQRYGDGVRGSDVDGMPALSMPALIRSCLEQAGVSAVEFVGDDTADDRWFSHRVRQDPERQTSVIWMEP